MTRWTSFVLFLLTATSLNAERVFRVKNADDLAAAAALLATPADSKAEPWVFRIAPGEYVLRHTLRILRSNVALLAEPGVRFRLADAVNEPVIAIGSQNEIPAESERVERIRLRGFEVDGNRGRQTSEVGHPRFWIRNNGIDVRMTKALVIEKSSRCRQPLGRPCDQLEILRYLRERLRVFRQFFRRRRLV